MALTEQLHQTKGLLSVNEVAQFLSCHPMTVYAWAKEAKIPHIRVGSRLKFDPAALAEWLEARSMAG